MTDETRPERAASGPQEKDAALDSWFRPRDASKTDGARPASASSSADGADDRPAAPAEPDGDAQAAPEGKPATGTPSAADPTQALPRAAVGDSPDNDVTQLALPKLDGAASNKPSGADKAPPVENDGASASSVASASGVSTPEASASEGSTQAESTPGASTTAATSDSPDAPTGVNGAADDATQLVPLKDAAASTKPIASDDAIAPTKPVPSKDALSSGDAAPAEDAASSPSADPALSKDAAPSKSALSSDDVTGAVGKDSLPGADDRTQVIPAAAASPKRPYAAAAPTQAIPRTEVPATKPQQNPQTSDMAVRGASPRAAQGYGTPAASAWSPQAPARQHRPYEGYPTPPGEAPILPIRAHDDYDDFDEYGESVPGRRRPSGARNGRRGLMVTTGVVAVLAVLAALVFTGKIDVPGLSAKPVPTVGFSPSSSEAGTDTTQTGTAFLTDWQNGSLKAAANITDNPSAALAALTAYRNDLKVSGLTLLPGSASTGGWMTFNVTAQVGKPASPWSYSSGMAIFSKDIDGYTRWFVKWQPSLLFTSLKPGQKLGLGLVPATADKVVDRNGNEITGANAPSLNGIAAALKKSTPATDGTPGQKVQIENADGSPVSTVVKVSDPVSTSAVKTTLDLKVQAAAQTAVNQAPNSSMVVIQPSTGNILAVANNPTNGLDTAMVGRYAPGSTFKTITTTLVLDKGVITDLNQTWDCPQLLNADGITLHNSEQEAGVGRSFLWDFADSCNNAFSRFEGKVSKDELARTAHDYYGFNQKWDVGLGQPTTYGNVPTTSANSLAEELVGQDQITASPLVMASVAATVANGSFKQPIMVPGAQQLTLTPLPAATDQNLKTLMHEVVNSGTLAGVLTQPGAYGKTGTAEVQGKPANSWTIAVHGDFAVAALAVGGNFGASTAGPECDTLLKAVS